MPPSLLGMTMADKMAVYGLRHQRSRLAGEITKLKEWNCRNEAKIEGLRTRIAVNKGKIAALTSQIDAMGDVAKIAFTVELAPPAPRQTRPKKHFAAWGAITRETLCCLKDATGTPLTTLQVAERINQKLQLNLSAEQLPQLVNTIRTTMKRLNGKKVRCVAEAASVGAYSTWVLADTVE